MQKKRVNKYNKHVVEFLSLLPNFKLAEIRKGRMRLIGKVKGAPVTIAVQLGSKDKDGYLNGEDTYSFRIWKMRKEIKTIEQDDRYLEAIAVYEAIRNEIGIYVHKFFYPNNKRRTDV